MKTPLFALALLASTAFAQTPLDKTMVVINGQAIDAKTYFKRMEVMPNVGQLVNDKFVPGTPGFLTVSKLMNETLLLQLAKEKGVFPGDPEVDAKVKQETADNPDMLPALQKIGFTLDDYKYEIRLKLAEFKLQTMGVNITDMEVEKFYKDNVSNYTLPKRYLLRVIAVDTEEKKRAVDEALNGGKEFGKVALEMSLDISRANYGQMGEVPEAAMQNATAAAVKSTKKGGTTEWLSNGQMAVKFLVEDVLPEKVLPLDAALKTQIREGMMVERGRVKNNLPMMMDDMRKRAKIEFQGTMFDSQLKSAFGKN